MNALISRKTSRFLPLWLAVLMIAGLILAPSAQAVRYLSNGTGDINDGTEGDPLDANDYSNGDPFGGDVHDNCSLIESVSGGAIFAAPTHDAMVYLIIDFRGRIPSLQVIRVSRVASNLEDTDAR